jgi:hypothetical protein
MLAKRLARLVWVTAIGAVLLALGSWAAEADQVAVRFYPPLGKTPAMQQLDEAFCASHAAGYVRLDVECMQARGYRPEIVGQGGVHMTVGQLPMPPGRVVPQPGRPPATPAPAPQASSCESQVNQCRPCQNGRYRATSFSCVYESFADCRSSILQFCKEHPSSDKALDVRGGRLTDHQVDELIMSCPNVPHGTIPFSGSPPAPGSKKWEQCQAFLKSYVGCTLVRKYEDRRRCLRTTYSGP